MVFSIGLCNSFKDLIYLLGSSRLFLTTYINSKEMSYWLNRHYREAIPCSFLTLTKKAQTVARITT